MSFVKKKKVYDPLNKQKRKKIIKIIGTIFVLILLTGGSFFAYLYANGSKVFQNNFATSSLLKAFSGNDTGFEEERVNILVMGRGGDSHPGGSLTDSMIVVSIRPKEKKTALLSIPRDLIVPIKEHDEDKINSVFADGYNDYIKSSCKNKVTNACRDSAFGAGANFTRETTENILGINIKYYIVVDFDGFTKLVDALGGVDINVEKNLYDPLFPDKSMKGYEPFNIKAGNHHMDGELALKYARSRETTSDFDRSARQQKIIQGLREKALQSGILTNPKKIMDIVNIVGDHIRTNMSPSDLRTLADLLKDFDNSKAISKVLSNGATGLLIDDTSTGTYYLRPRDGDFTNVKDLAQNIFNEQEAVAPQSKIEVLNGTNSSGLATKLSNELKKQGFSSVSIGNADTKYLYSVIYDYSDGKYQSDLALIKKEINSSVVKKEKPNSNVDFSIVIGADYE